MSIGSASDNTSRDYELYKTLLDLWAKENPIKTTKLQVLLAVNGLLITAVNISGGFLSKNWPIYVAGAIFSAIWTFSIGRTCLFQDVWQLRIGELHKKHPDDPRFSVLESGQYKNKARRLMRWFGIVPSKYYLLLSPFGLALLWTLVLILTRSR